ncbi:MAG: Uma2 family endonuclease [Cyanobacteria bacterium P01_E01_bin.42]
MPKKGLKSISLPSGSFLFFLSDRHQVTVYRPNREPLLLQDGDNLSIPELFPGWELAIAEIWPPEFEG